MSALPAWSYPSCMAGALGHERLDVYRVALRLVGDVHRLTAGLRGRAAWIVRDQLIRAALAILLNIAEGNGESHAAERAKFFTYARRSADEAGACLDALVEMGLLRKGEITAAKDLIKRIVEMLVRLIQKTGASTLPHRS